MTVRFLSGTKCQKANLTVNKYQSKIKQKKAKESKKKKLSRHRSKVKQSGTWHKIGLFICGTLVNFICHENYNYDRKKFTGGNPQCNRNAAGR